MVRPERFCWGSTVRSDFNNLELMIPVLSMQAVWLGLFWVCFFFCGPFLSIHWVQERFSGFERKIQLKARLPIHPPNWVCG